MGIKRRKRNNTMQREGDKATDLASLQAEQRLPERMTPWEDERSKRCMAMESDIERNITHVAL